MSLRAGGRGRERERESGGGEDGKDTDSGVGGSRIGERKGRGRQGRYLEAFIRTW